MADAPEGPAGGDCAGNLQYRICTVLQTSLASTSRAQWRPFGIICSNTATNRIKGIFFVSNNNLDRQYM